MCTDCLALIQSGVQVIGLECLARLSLMSSCACGCGRRVKEAGHYRKVCRLRERAAGRPCPRNMISADQRVISEKKRCLNSCHLISRIKEFEEENSESCYLRNQTRSVRAKAPHNHRPRRWF